MLSQVNTFNLVHDIVLVGFLTCLLHWSRYELQNIWDEERDGVGAVLRKRLDALYTWYLSVSSTVSI